MLLLLLRLLLLLKLNSLCYLVVSLPLLKVNLWCTHGARRLLPLVFAACVWVRICESSLPALSFPRVTYVGCARNRFVSKCRGQFFTLFFFFFVLFPRFKCSLFHSIRFASHVADYFNGLLMSSTNFTFDYLPFFQLEVHPTVYMRATSKSVKDISIAPAVA